MMKINYAILLGLLCFFVSVAQQPGDLDTSFGINGISRYNLWDATFKVKSHAILTDGKIIVAGEIENGVKLQGFLVRLLNNGELDVTFGTQGKVVHPFLEGFNVVKVQSDGKLLVGSGYKNDFAVARYLANGTIDTGFAYDGTYYNIDEEPILGIPRKVIDIEIQSDNKIIGIFSLGVGTNNYQHRIFRLNTNGILDDTLNVVDSFGIGNFPVSLSLQTDGKIVIGGKYNIGTNTTVFVARYNSNGSVDNTFNSNGRRTFTLSGTSDINPTDMLLQPDGKIVLGGNFFFNANRFLFLVRINTNGSFDTSFSDDGFYSVNVSSDVGFGTGKIALQPDGKIIQMDTYLNPQTNFRDILLVRYFAVGGVDTTFNGGTLGATFSFNNFNDSPGDISIVNNQLFVSGNTEASQIQNNMAFARLDLNPTSLDSSFGNGGFKQLAVSHPTYEKIFKSIIQSDNKVVTLARIFVNEDFYWAIHRYNEDGTLDTTFGDNGKLGLTVFFSNFDIGIDNNNKIIVAGRSVSSTGFIFRLTPDGDIDTTFGNQGITNFPQLSNFSFKINSIKVQSDNKIILGGLNANAIDNTNFLLIRFNADGTFDTTFGINGISQVGLNNNPESIQAIEVVNDGKILAVGYTRENFGNDLQAVIMRFNAVGLLDPTFNGNGKFLTGIPVEQSMKGDIKLQADGKILTTFESNSSLFSLFRFNSNGTLDTTFASGGVANTIINANEKWAQIYYNPTTQLITVIGTTYDVEVGKFALVRYFASGDIDFNFGNSGVVVTDLNGSGEVVTATPTNNGKLVVSGVFYDEAINDFDQVLAKYYLEESLSLVNKSEVNVQLYPNPVAETLYVQLKNGTKAENYSVTDMNGRVVLNGKLKIEHGINVSGLAAGTYLISIDAFQPTKFLKR